MPLFFGCAAFLLLRRLTENTAQNHKLLLRYCRRIFTLYALWSAVYILAQLPQWAASPRWDFDLLKEQIRLFFCEASYYHLWYLLATVYAVPLVYLLYKAGKRVMLATAAPLWCLRCLEYTYAWTGFLRPQFSWLERHCDTVLNPLLCAVPLMCIGALVLADHRKHNPKTWAQRSLLSLLLFLAELTAAYLLSVDKQHFEFLFTTPLVAYHVLCWLLSLELQLPERHSSAMRHASTWIYCIHPLVILIWNRHSEIVGLRRFAIVSVVCLLTSILYAATKLRKERLKCV